MGAPETAITSMQISCSGLTDYGYTDWHRDSSARFNATEAEILNTRFAKLNALLNRDAADVHDRCQTVRNNLMPNSDQSPNFESRPLHQFHSDMPENFDFPEFVDGW